MTWEPWPARWSWLCLIQLAKGELGGFWPGVALTEFIWLQSVNWDGVGKTGNRDTCFEDFSSYFGDTWWGKNDCFLSAKNPNQANKETKKWFKNSHCSSTDKCRHIPFPMLPFCELISYLLSLFSSFFLKKIKKKKKKKAILCRDFPGGPVVKTLFFHCRGRQFDPWSGN